MITTSVIRPRIHFHAFQLTSQAFNAYHRPRSIIQDVIRIQCQRPPTSVTLFRLSQSSFPLIQFTHVRKYNQPPNSSLHPQSFEAREAATRAKIQSQLNATQQQPQQRPQPQTTSQPHFTPTPTQHLYATFITLLVIYTIIYTVKWNEYRSHLEEVPITRRKHYINEEQEKELHAEARTKLIGLIIQGDPQMLDKGNETVRDLQAVVNRLAKTEIVREAEGREKEGLGKGEPWTVFVADTSIPLLTAKPDKAIHITTSMLPKISSETHLAIHLATTIARVICKHKAENRSYKHLSDSLAYPMLPFGQILSYITDFLQITSYLEAYTDLLYMAQKREQSFECDIVALNILDQAEYDIRQVPEFWKQEFREKGKELRIMQARARLLGVGGDLKNEEELSVPRGDKRAERIEAKVEELLRGKTLPVKEPWEIGSVVGGRRAMKWKVLRKERFEIGVVGEEEKGSGGDVDADADDNVRAIKGGK